MTIDSKSFNMLNYIVNKALPILLFVFCLNIANADSNFNYLTIEANFLYMYPIDPYN